MNKSIDRAAIDFADTLIQRVNELTDRLAELPREWEALGIDPDAFVTCATCRGILFEDAMLPGDVACSCAAKIVQ